MKSAFIFALVVLIVTITTSEGNKRACLSGCAGNVACMLSNCPSQLFQKRADYIALGACVAACGNDEHCKFDCAVKYGG
ncbi:hypothetical protein Btru_033740 [Bulinus truncatus]|nr:hypothetical protein Btru_033740 [Bulinus truncatus]